jgi:hypothetical protein
MLLQLLVQRGAAAVALGGAERREDLAALVGVDALLERPQGLGLAGLPGASFEAVSRGSRP